MNSRKCQNGGSGGRARGRELLDGHGEEQMHSSRKSQQEDYSPRSERQERDAQEHAPERGGRLRQDLQSNIRLSAFQRLL